ncbi:MAG: primosomal protein N', partial [Pseudomonadales bacterium]|nr:primosomal protein N' [Pseudomonadales bacterium]
MSDSVLLNIAVPLPLRASYTYRWPKILGPVPAPGCRVRIPFGSRKITGIVLEQVTHHELPEQKIRAVEQALDDTPLFSQSLLGLCQWAASYYHHPLGEVLETAIPKLLREGRAATRTRKQLTLLVPAQDALLATMRAPAQRQLIMQLQQGPATSQSLKAADISSATIRSAVDKGLIAWQETLAQDEPFKPGQCHVSLPDIQLHTEQQQAIDHIRSQSGGTFLLNGVTGSGKTEVYFRLIADVLARGQQVLVLVPEIGLTPQTIERFNARFSCPVVVMHSALADGERYENYLDARSGAAAIIIGTRSAVFAPLKHPGLIVVDEEHDTSFKQHEGFRYSARDIAVKRGHDEGIPVLLGSATPSLESWYNVRTGKYTCLNLTTRAGGASKPRTRILDIRHQPLQDGFSPGMIERMAHTLQQGNQVLVFQNRRGFSPVLLCHECSWLAGCPHCDARLTWHADAGRLMCHHCLTSNPPPRCCPSCDSAQLIPVGLGTQRIEQTLQRLLPGYPVIRVDRDSTRTRSAFEKLTERILQGDPLILVGTQMLAKGHHFPDVTLVTILDIDGGFYSADHRAMEKTGQLLVQVAGRAGRADKPGTVILQTHFPEDQVLHQLTERPYSEFL